MIVQVADNGSTNGISIGTEFGLCACEYVYPCIAGSEMSGGIRNVTVLDVSINNCFYGLFIKSMRGRGGYVEDVSFSNIVVSNILGQAIRFAMFYDYFDEKSSSFLPSSNSSFPNHTSAVVQHDADRVPPDVPIFRRLYVSNVTSKTNIVTAGAFLGLNDSAISEIVLTNITIQSLFGFTCEYASGVSQSVLPMSCLSLV